MIINEKSKFQISSNAILGVFFVIPIILGFLLSNIFCIDVSSFVKDIFGLFQFLELAGRAIQTKTMIFLIALICSPLVLLYIKRLESPIALQEGTSTIKVLYLLITVILFFIAFYFLVVVGPPELSLNRPLKAVGLLLVLAKSDILFGMASIAGVMVIVLLAYIAVILTKALIMQLKK